MSVIVQTASSSYGHRMTAAMVRFLTLLALVLMPFGMAGTPAIAQPMAQNGHCDQQSDHDKAPVHKSQQMHCAMCAALPASDPPNSSAAIPHSSPRLIATVSPFNGIELEIATPPPRRG